MKEKRSAPFWMRYTLLSILALRSVDRDKR
jgi:hypothetical protein